MRFGSDDTVSCGGSESRHDHESHPVFECDLAVIDDQSAAAIRALERYRTCAGVNLIHHLLPDLLFCRKSAGDSIASWDFGASIQSAAG